MSIMPSPLPSRWAAMPRIAPMVTTPVPPTPVTMMLNVWSIARDRGLGQRLEGQRRRRDGLGDRLLHLRAMHRHEGRAEALHAGEVLVAVRLVDLPLASELGLDRLHGHAVGLHGAIAAGLADEIVDDDALVRIRKLVPFAPPTLLGRAGLVVDHAPSRPGSPPACAATRVQLVADGGSSCRPATGCSSGTCPARRLRARCAPRLRHAPGGRSCRPSARPRAAARPSSRRRR